MAKFGNANETKGTNIINIALIFNFTEHIPTFYEIYLGSIADVSKLESTLEAANAYGFPHVGFVLD